MLRSVEKNEIVKILRGGVREIISRASPPCHPELCGKYRRSSHPGREFLFVLDGNSRFLCNNSVYPCRPGTLFLFDSGVSHGHYYTKEDNGLLHLWGYFPRRLHLSCFQITVNGQYRLVPQLHRIFIPEGVTTLLGDRWNLLARQEHVTAEMVEHYMKGPLDAVLDEAAFQLSELPRPERPDTPVEGIKEYILSRNGRECSLEHLGGVFGYSRCHLAHKFRESEGITVGAYIDRIRMEYIRTAKARGTRQKEMAYELGFSSPAAFWNWLRKHRDPAPRSDAT